MLDSGNLWHQMKKRFNTFGGSLLACAFLCGQTAFGQTRPTPPPQPTTGPGSNQYLYGVLQSGPFVVSGKGKNSGYTYYTYTPIGLTPSPSDPNPLPTPTSAPVVLFLCAEDRGATAPSDYLFLLTQLTSMGFSTVFANYNTGGLQKNYLAVIQADLADALNTLATNSTLVPPALDSSGQPLYTVVGHSEGGYLAVNLAATAVGAGLPIPQAVVSFEANSSKLAAFNPQGINANTLVILVIGNDDTEGRICPSVTLWTEMTQIALVNRPFIYVQSDTHGSPAQLGNHWFPLTYTSKDTDPPGTTVDDRDWNITFKLSVAATACVMNGVYCDYALGNGPLNPDGTTTQTEMGYWSDGTIVKPLELVPDPYKAFASDSCPIN